MARRGTQRELSDWLDRHGYNHAHATKKTAHPYAVSTRMAHARMIESPVTGREIFASKERDHHITTRGRQLLEREQFALPPGPEEKRRGIKGRLPIDTIKRARSALARASMMHHDRAISTQELDEARRAVHRAWPSIEVEVHHARMIESPVTGRELFAARERDHHITTAGRLALSAEQFALPPGPEEKRRGIKGRLPIDTVKRARNALQRAAQMEKRGHISAAQLATVRRKVHAAWPSIEVGA
jgi:hypothetical protein